MKPIWHNLFNPAVIWVLIPIAWLLLSTIVELIKLVQRHRERMALINQGIHPDLEPDPPGCGVLDGIDDLTAK